MLQKNEVQTVVWALARFLLTRTQTTQNRQALAGLYGHTNTYYAVGMQAAGSGFSLC